jgi:hypothetical protein
VNSDSDYSITFAAVAVVFSDESVETPEFSRILFGVANFGIIFGF